jgi:hypothetical protein
MPECIDNMATATRHYLLSTVTATQLPINETTVVMTSAMKLNCGVGGDAMNVTYQGA